MSKQVKQMQMNEMKKTFHGIRDLVFMSVSGVSAQEDNQMRQALRKKNIRLQVVKNSLARRIFKDLDVQVQSEWAGPTTVAWGAGSVAELSKEVDTLAKKNKKIVVKLAVAEGLEVTFKQALAMPTRAQAIGRVLMLALSPASRVAGQLKGPAGRVAGQIKTVSEKPAEEAAPPPADTPIMADTPATPAG